MSGYSGDGDFEIDVQDQDDVVFSDCCGRVSMAVVNYIYIYIYMYIYINPNRCRAKRGLLKMI